MKKKIIKILFVVCILVCVAGIGYLCWYYTRKQENGDIYAKMQRDVLKDKQQYLELGEPKEIIPIDFAELKEINEDIYAWIEIPDTNVNYPIVQSPTDDSYYLNHTIEGKAGYPGSIYTEKINSREFDDFLTVIYGHDMKDGSMFKHLHKYEDADFFENHDKITIYTEDECKVYQVFAAVVYDDRHLMYSFDYDDTEGREAFIQSLYESRNMKNHIREDVEVDENSHIIILSTCIAGKPNNRYLVGAVEIDE